ncbi:bifunctional hydroxymethylpyrimidine kinase/phosphomethylpyrimidine kinase [Microlunatus sp. Gsoil 973]|uniref:bifunctional hydroxymethylpyrimidine kinase/phosphomethylpyrimidine kinase n=1 Tax=Microlunatus sp. Gsoil 973 TaxID=2672569 RepID=UPI0012B4B338|nr:bifunctional hydroxymethylpyrimidine kinase/phosphomethylpyrimidine kinase [Microlunatus sp. Gsoil 973]QGN32057.1 bifunctional hydroxymethylpyrimidine kinase/phosphomethylpyrimidine kinase [Microlunatus sp. Gsoil 973]
MTDRGRTAIMLSIAGSDPSGGAGIQADLKTATALGVYGAAVITSLTVQNTRGVSGIQQVPADFVAAQARAVLDDLDVGAIKIGMLAGPAVASAVAGVLAEHPDIPMVLDPVMVATSGDRLVTPETTAVIIGELLPRATVVTPNLPETGALLDLAAPRLVEEMVVAAEGLRDQGAAAALVKGGHLTGSGVTTPSGEAQSVDVLADADGVTRFTAPWIETPNTHGTGCTLSSAIATRLALGDPLRAAVGTAKDYLTGALRAGVGLRIGDGSGPVDHLWELRR